MRPGTEMLEGYQLTRIYAWLKPEDHGVVVLEEEADFLYHLLPDAVHDPCYLDGAHFTGTLSQVLHLRKAQEAYSGLDAFFLEAVGNEGGEEIMVAHEIDDEGFPYEGGLFEEGDVLQGKRRFPERAHGHEAEAIGIVCPDAGLGEDFLKAGGGFFHGYEGAGEEMEGVLAGGDDGSGPALFLEAYSGDEPGKAAAGYYCIEFHIPSTCL